MTPEEQQICIAEACGWKNVEREMVSFDGWTTYGDAPKGGRIEIPDYLNDLNAMRDAENALGEVHSIASCEYDDWLTCITGNDQTWRATAAQRAEAFLRTLSLWQE